MEIDATGETEKDRQTDRQIGRLQLPTADRKIRSDNDSRLITRVVQMTADSQPITRE